MAEWPKCPRFLLPSTSWSIVTAVWIVSRIGMSLRARDMEPRFLSSWPFQRSRNWFISTGRGIAFIATSELSVTREIWKSDIYCEWGVINHCHWLCSTWSYGKVVPKLWFANLLFNAACWKVFAASMEVNVYQTTRHNTCDSRVQWKLVITEPERTQSHSHFSWTHYCLLLGWVTPNHACAQSTLSLTNTNFQISSFLSSFL